MLDSYEKNNIKNQLQVLIKKVILNSLYDFSFLFIDTSPLRILKSISKNVCNEFSSSIFILPINSTLI